tara:strand:- start:123 stop:503 length:381 start_codon:yes stop_codon:yes gene_type:complete
MLRVYLVALAVFLIIDLVWIGLVAKNFYFSQLDSLLSGQVNWAPALLFYALFILGLVVFVILPHQEAPVIKQLLYCILFGAVTYGTWNLTCYSLFKDFPWQVVAVDLTWGCCISTIVSFTVWKVLG